MFLNKFNYTKYNNKQYNKKGFLNTTKSFNVLLKTKKEQ